MNISYIVNVWCALVSTTKSYFELLHIFNFLIIICLFVMKTDWLHLDEWKYSSVSCKWVQEQGLHIPKLIKVITRILSGDHTLAANIVFNYIPHLSTSKWHFQIFLLTSLTVSANNGQPHAKGNKSPLTEGYDGDNIYRNFPIQPHYVQIDSKHVTGRWEFHRENKSQLITALYLVQP